MRIVVHTEYNCLDEVMVKEYLATQMVGGMGQADALKILQGEQVSKVNKDPKSPANIITTWQIFADPIGAMKPPSKLILAPGDVPRGTK